MTTEWRGTATPILPVADLEHSVAFYRSLGFEVEVSSAGRYGFVRSGALQLHLSETEGFDPFVHAGMAYLYVDDVDAIRAALTREDAAALSHVQLRERWEWWERGSPSRASPRSVRSPGVCGSFRCWIPTTISSGSAASSSDRPVSPRG